MASDQRCNVFVSILVRKSGYKCFSAKISDEKRRAKHKNIPISLFRVRLVDLEAIKRKSSLIGTNQNGEFMSPYSFKSDTDKK